MLQNEPFQGLPISENIRKFYRLVDTSTPETRSANFATLPGKLVGASMYVMSPDEVEKAVTKWLTHNYNYMDFENAAEKLNGIESKTNWLESVR